MGCMGIEDTFPSPRSNVTAIRKGVKSPSGGGGTTGGGAGSPPGVSYSYIIFHDGFEQATHATKPSDLDRTLNSGAVLDNGVAPAAPVGSYSLDTPTASDYASYPVTTADIFDPTHGRLGMYIYIEATAAYHNFFVYSIDGNNEFLIRSWENANLCFQYKGGGTQIRIISGANTASTGSWHYVEAKLDNTGNSYQMWVDNAAVGEDATSITFTGSSGTIYLGDTEDGAFDFHFDNFIISDDQTKSMWAIKDLTSYPD